MEYNAGNRQYRCSDLLKFREDRRMDRTVTKMIRRKKFAVMFAVALVILFTGLSRVNVYEIMFHPMGRPNFASVTDTKLDGAEMVMAVHIAGVARAYPIRIVSYHHIVNDVVGGVPIVATY